MPQCQNGDIVAVHSADKKPLGWGMMSLGSSQIVCRMISFDMAPYLDTIKKKVLDAIQSRRSFFDEKKTTAYRLINAEGDLLPGLVVDQYGKTLVIQIGNAGMEKLKPHILEILIAECRPDWIYEKSQSPLRRQEGLAPVEETIYGAPCEPVSILENGLQFLVSPTTGQKTGFFLDQRNMRSYVREMAKGRRVLNCFSYTGAFSVAALAGGALHCDSVDICPESIGQVTNHIQLNGLASSCHHEYCADVFEFLRSMENLYDCIILDPPAFAKKKGDIIQAARGYKDIMRLALKNLAPNSYLLTCSCSYHVSEKLFRQILFSAALEAKRDVRIISKHRLAEDHPIDIYHLEGEYLKSFFCFVN